MKPKLIGLAIDPCMSLFLGIAYLRGGQALIRPCFADKGTNRLAIVSHLNPGDKLA
jgi:hypothetical protein